MQSRTVGRRRPTMADVGRLAGVSATTVSFVLNERPDSGISPDTRERVLTAARELGYRPNRQARSLRLGRTGKLGFHVTGDQLSVGNLFPFAFLQPLLTAATDRGYQLLVFTAGADAADRMAALVAGNEVDGFVLTDSREDDARLRYLATAGVPFASFGRTDAGLPQNWVDVDNVAGMADMVDHLVVRGHERLAFVGDPAPRYWFRERLEGFLARTAHHGLTVPPDQVVHPAPDRIEAAVHTLLDRPQRPSALVAAGDAVALDVMRAVHSYGLRVGRDVAVTGFDGGPLRRLTSPALTTVQMPFQEVAEYLVARCLQEITAGSTGAPGRYLPTTVVIGDSG